MWQVIDIEGWTKWTYVQKMTDEREHQLVRLESEEYKKRVNVAIFNGMDGEHAKLTQK